MGCMLLEKGFLEQKYEVKFMKTSGVCFRISMKEKDPGDIGSTAAIFVLHKVNSKKKQKKLASQMMFAVDKYLAGILGAYVSSKVSVTSFSFFGGGRGGGGQGYTV